MNPIIYSVIAIVCIAGIAMLIAGKRPKPVPKSSYLIKDNEGSGWTYQRQVQKNGNFLFRDYGMKIRSLTIAEVKKLGLDKNYDFGKLMVEWENK